MRPVRLSARGNAAPASPIRKLVPIADQARARGIKVWGLNIGQPDIVTPERMWEAALKDHPEVLAYSPSAGIPELRSALSGYYEKHGIGLSADDLIVTTGGSEAILFAFAVLADPGDEVMIPEPLYANYLGFGNMLGVKVVPIPTRAEDGYHLPPPASWEERLTSRTRAILFCNPGNPTGTVYTEKEVEMVLGMAQDWGLWVIADEVYREFCYDGLKHRSILTWKSVADRVILVDSISKRFSACGARIGCLGSTNRELISVATRYAQARLSPPSVGQWMATAALTLTDDYYAKLTAEFQKRRDIVMEEFTRMAGVRCETPRGAFYAMPTLPVEDAEAFAVWMLNEFQEGGETVLIAPGNGFYATPGAGQREGRVAYVFAEESLRRALRVLAAGLAQYPGRLKTEGASAAMPEAAGARRRL
jgi:aspartate aminotransferase